MPSPKRKKAKKKQKKRQRMKRSAARTTTESEGRIRYRVNADLPDIPGMKSPNYTILSDRKVTLDHGKAFWYCDLPIFPGEREITNIHVQKLYDRMRRGSFNERIVTISTCRFEGVTYKINGQHTCWALVNMPDDYSLQVREIRFEASTKEDLKAIYSMFDQNLPRTEGHLTKVRLVDTETTAGVHVSLLNGLISGLKFWLFESTNDRRRHHDEEMTLLAKKHSQVFRSVAFILQDNKDSIGDVKKQPVVAAMMATYYKVPRMADQFWSPVITGLDLIEKNDARWRLRKYLAEHTTGATHRASTKKSASPEAMYRVCINCWSKWRKGEPMVMTPKATKRRMKAV